MTARTATVQITAAPVAFYTAASLLVHSLNRGDFDEDPDFDNEAAYASGLLVEAADLAINIGDTVCSVTLDGPVLDEILAVLDTNQPAIDTPLSEFITAANTGFEQAFAASPPTGA